MTLALRIWPLDLVPHRAGFRDRFELERLTWLIICAAQPGANGLAFSVLASYGEPKWSLDPFASLSQLSVWPPCAARPTPGAIKAIAWWPP